MRVAMSITSYHPIVGGAERQIAQLSAIMLRWGHDVRVITRRHEGLLSRETVDGVPVRRVGAAGPLAAPSFLAAATAALRAERPDVIHCHSLFTPALAGVMAGATRATSVLVKPMCGGEASAIAAKPFGGFRLRQVFKGSARLIAVSAEIERELESLGAPPEKIRRIPNGVNAGRFRPCASAAEKAELRAGFGLPDGGPLFVFAGRMARQKRLPMLLGIWRRVMEASPDARLLVAGANRSTARGAISDDPDAVSLPDALLDQPGVRFLGHVDDMPTLLRAADVFVLPSAREGLSNAMLEACASGLPTVAARIGGAEDLIDSGENGFLFPVDDPDALAEALSRLAGDADLRARLGAAARARVERDFAIEETARRLLSTYDEAVEEARSRRRAGDRHAVHG